MKMLYFSEKTSAILLSDKRKQQLSASNRYELFVKDREVPGDFYRVT